MSADLKESILSWQIKRGKYKNAEDFKMIAKIYQQFNISWA